MLSGMVWQEPVNFKNAFFGHVLNQPKLPKHVGVGSPGQKNGVVLYPTFGLRGVIRAFLGDRRFPGKEEG